MKCTKCGSELLVNARFCSKCGATVPTPEQISEKKRKIRKRILVTATTVVVVAALAFAYLFSFHRWIFLPSEEDRTIYLAISEVVATEYSDVRIESGSFDRNGVLNCHLAFTDSSGVEQSGNYKIRTNPGRMTPIPIKENQFYAEHRSSSLHYEEINDLLRKSSQGTT